MSRIHTYSSKNLGNVKEHSTRIIGIEKRNKQILFFSGKISYFHRMISYVKEKGEERGRWGRRLCSVPFSPYSRPRLAARANTPTRAVRHAFQNHRDVKRHPRRAEERCRVYKVASSLPRCLFPRAWNRNQKRSRLSKGCTCSITRQNDVTCGVAAPFAT